MRRIGTLLLVVVPALLIAATAMVADCQTPTALEDGWRVAAPEQEGLDPALICGIGPRLEALKEAAAHGVVIVRHGRLIYEHYFAGKDQRLGTPIGDVNFDTGTMHDVHSITKSVTSLLVGIALDRGLLADLDAPVFSFFPEYGHSRKRPYYAAAASYDVLRICLAREQRRVQQSIEQPLANVGGSPCRLFRPATAAPPGTLFNYNIGWYRWL